MALPLSYNVRNVRHRWQVTMLAVSGIALVVAVFTVLMAMSEGFSRALRSTGRPDNAMIVQRGSASELTSWIPIDQRNLILVRDEVARDTEGQPLASPEDVVVTNKPKKDGSPTNVTVRGVTPKAFDVRGGIKILDGRKFTPGLYEVIVGDKIARRVRGLELGSSVKLQKHEWKVVGTFSSQGGAFESEIWGDADVMGVDFGRTGGYNAMSVRLKPGADVTELDHWIRSNPQMQLQAVSERKYYDDQAGPLAKILRQLATFVAVIMGVGAVFGAMNTMYAIVAARTREIGTLRALGFSRRAILFSFVVESVTLALAGGAIGCLLAVPMNGYSTGTGQTQSFSEIAFAFQITPGIVMSSVAFAVVMGVIGGLLPSVRAARLPITSALREA
ncbi:MAG TPA: ABC transporter permease [Vicinamibacteria bacterium]|jgi:putative ABC transport system permease protein|nr:ABC transporter permease [Vicinamibacteria bacterium]